MAKISFYRGGGAEPFLTLTCRTEDREQAEDFFAELTRCAAGSGRNYQFQVDK